MASSNSKKQAGVGAWESPITSELITAKVLRLSSPAWTPSGAVLFLEGRPLEGGRNVAVARNPDGSFSDVTPGPDSKMNVRTRVHEYGGGAYLVTPEGHLFFSNFGDQRVYKQDLGAQDKAPKAVTPEGKLRFADYTWDAHRKRLIAVCESHEDATSDGATGVVNTVVAIDPESGKVETLVSGNDFFISPRLSPDGSRLAWVAWDFPNMPWDGTTLHIAKLDPHGKVKDVKKVAGGPDESVQQPVWNPSGSRLYYISDAGSGWWNLFEYDTSTETSTKLLDLPADFGWPQWLFGYSTYALLGGGTHILALYNDPTVAGTSLGLIDLSSNKAPAIQPINTGFTSYDRSLAVREDQGGGIQVVVVAAGATSSTRLAQLSVGSIPALLSSQPKDWVTLRSSADIQLDPGHLSAPQKIEFPTEGGKTAFMLYYPPRNREYEYPQGTLPPLVVHSHGGPTSAAQVSLSLAVQYFTSRGWAVADVDYGGSTGYGREYRNRLRGTWGIVDIDDCCNAAKYLASQGLVDSKRMAISGGSAGGFTTLAALAFRKTFQAGCSLYGVADLQLLAEHTHKFESRYLDLLVGRLPEDKATYDARSPIKHVDGFSSPVIFFQGDEDEIVPPEQAILMHKAVKEKGLVTSLVMFKGEQHGFRGAAAIRASLDGELYFYNTAFGLPASMPEGVEVPEIDNLPGK